MRLEGGWGIALASLFHLSSPPSPLSRKGKNFFGRGGEMLDIISPSPDGAVCRQERG